MHLELKQTIRTRGLVPFLLTGILTLTGCRAEKPYEVLETKGHDPSLFTQGLIVEGNDLIESSGGYGNSKLIRYNAETGKLLNSAPLPKTVFAEGIHQLDNSIVLLTWRENRAYRLDADTFLIRQVFPLETEGWGLTHDSRNFIQSDGSDQLYFRNSSTFKIEKTITVRDAGEPQDRLNELEFAKGLIWANIYTTPMIVAIEPNSGEVVFTLDLSELTAKHHSNAPGYELNGIAYDPARDAFWVTGKRWNKRYLIKIHVKNDL